jgi:hypothetical protein
MMHSITVLKTKCLRTQFFGCSTFLKNSPEKICLLRLLKITLLLQTLDFFAITQKFATKILFFILSLESLLKVPFKTTMTGAGRGMRPAAPPLPLQERSEEGGARRPAAEMRQD